LLYGFEEALDGPYRRAGPWAECVLVLLGPREDLGAVGELEELHGIRAQSDDGVVIIGGFFLSKIAVE
jgi:hypothetical protein